MRWLTDVPFAHRGLHDAAAGAPENSLAAFGRALERGYGIEVDVRLSRDGVAVAFHDKDLARMVGPGDLIEDMDAATLGGLALLGTRHNIPLLEDVLRLVRGRAPLLIEVKPLTRRLDQLERAVLQPLRDYEGDFAVMSFAPRILLWFYRNAPECVRGQIAKDWAPARRPLSYTHFVNYDLRGLPHPALARARKRGLPLLAWTARTEQDLAKAREYADNIVFEGFLP